MEDMQKWTNIRCSTVSLIQSVISYSYPRMRSMSKKPTGAKNYGSIPHLPKSRMGPADHACPEGMQRIATQMSRDKHDRVIVQEKLDGSNVGVAKIDGEIFALQRSGYLAASSPFIQHHYFSEWVEMNRSRFSALLDDGERICGEWLMQAHGTRYSLRHEPFVPFDIMRSTTRTTYDEFVTRVKSHGFTIPFCVHQGGPIGIHEVLEKLGEFGQHGAEDRIEGAVWRVETNRLIQPGLSKERRWEVDFIVKFVRPDKKDGSYLPTLSGNPEVWNVQPDELFD